MKRFEIIQQLIDENNYKTYLEIGTQQSVTGKALNIEYKVGVDPDEKAIDTIYYNEFYNMTSDEFFNIKKGTVEDICDEQFNKQLFDEQLFDIIFIDGDHSYEQSKMDFINAWNNVKIGGSIILHDSLPHNKEYTSMLWNGEVFKTINTAIRMENIKNNYYIIDTDHGCTIVTRNIDTVFIGSLDDENFYTYEQFSKDKLTWNIITPEEFKSKKHIITKEQKDIASKAKKTIN